MNEAFTQIEKHDQSVELIEMSPDLYYEAKQKEGVGTMELPYLIDFNKKELWNAPISLNSDLARNKAYCYGAGKKISVLLNG
jgi:hypothetical protein